ncbi:putative Ig domain-containing protein [Myxococcus sp. CA039A]|uniref:putative Ig domain-containing protein n=1 Tax=Myxococcus sp. CA039A TaxID=2741737 RepID=UPI00157AECF5|nr:putative Ig domain-containing protein [Myxococcus sp. CA039A]NTX51746.1 lamin tail domain-containing protein [Myxococcus sp. CA039A]
MLSHRAVAPLLVLFLFTACSDSDPTPGPVDSGTKTDAGPGHDGDPDGGPPLDGGPDTDAGPTLDGGPDTDGGFTPDSGPDTDGGFTPDSGPDLDGGFVPDAGPDTDGGSTTPPVVLTETLADTYTGDPYSLALSASGGLAPLTWDVTAGALPAGLTLGTNGSLAGTPSAAGDATFTVRVRDASGASDTADLALSVYARPRIVQFQLSSHEVGESVSLTLTVVGGKAPITFARVGDLPPGLTLSAQGLLQGTFTEAGQFSFVVSATDANGRQAQYATQLTVLTAFSVTTASLPGATRDAAYQSALAATGGVEPLSWAVTMGALPDGLTLSSEGVLSGTPTVQGTFDLIVTATDSTDRTASRSLVLTISSFSPPVFKVGHYNLTYFGSDTQGPVNSTSQGGALDDLQIASARDVMLQAGANLWGMVEMVDVVDFDTLKAQLPGFSGFLSNNANYVTGSTSPYGGTTQKLGILYDSTLTFQSAELLRVGSESDFGNRPPLRVNFTTEIQGTQTPLVVIVVHMRAENGVDTSPRATRERASAALKEYLDQNLSNEHVLVLGDWNDDVDESITLDPGTQQPMLTPYQNFVSDPNGYTFITRELSLAGDDTSIGFENMVDHTLASNEVAARYVPSSAEVIYADEWVPDYLNTLSDHRPVVSTYAFSSAPEPFVRLKDPHGGTFLAGSVLPIRWHAWGVGDVRVEATTDGGTTWSVLAASVPAVQGSHAWTLPALSSTNTLVRVVDTSNATLFDGSDSPVTIVQGASRVIINEVLANEPAVNGNNNPAYEFVELVNVGAVAVDISGWSVWDSALSRHVFPAGTTLGAGKAVVVFGGAAGIPPGRTNAVRASSGALGLSNDGDTVRLRKADNTDVDTYSYVSPADNVSDNRSPDADPNGAFVRHTSLPSGLSSSPGLRADGTAF